MGEAFLETLGGMEEWRLVAGSMVLPLAPPISLLPVCQEVRTTSLPNVPALMCCPKLVPHNIDRHL